MSSEKSVLPSKLSEGPHGLGDPEDKTLRKVEIEVMIPKLMREKAKAEKCTDEVKDFEKCCKDSSLFMVVKCRKENSALRDCLTNWYRNEEFKQICTEQYLKERSEYRTTGIKKSIRRA
ncbi:cmc1 protein [Aphomia sociella]